MIVIYQKEDCIYIRGEIKYTTISDLDRELQIIFQSNKNQNITIDLSEVSAIDSIGVAYLDELAQTAAQKEYTINFVNMGGQVAEAISNFSTPPLQAAPPTRRIGFFERLGDFTINSYNKFLFLLYLIADIFYWAGIGLINYKGQRKGSFIQQSVLIGVNSVKIVCMISLLIGFILALQSASQLRQFGANIFIADLIGIAMTAEMGPIMTAIILAGRSGSAFASEIATMVVTEEIDAIRTMGLNPIRFIVVPKFHAISVTMPLLTILADIVGIMGGFIIATTYLELSPSAFFNELLSVVYLIDIISGLVKSIVFAWIIIIVGTYFGFTVKGGAEGVGRATTASVVVSIFVIIIADSILGLLFYFGRPAY
ncbi:MlaE family lipid ABC transporter permease subunit [candidate division KSB1 bacterium]|nr:MlaE family lipid ABC transporter permease subunit [candidate division KSB1 bacterium]